MLRRNVFISLTLLGVICVVFGGCQSAPPPMMSMPPPTVTISQPVERAVIDYDEYTGRTAAVEEVEVRARVSGYLIKRNFKEGSEVQKGDLLFGDTRISDIDVTYLREHIAVVPQEVLLFGGTIADNIAFGKPTATELEIEDAAKKANAWEFISSFPEGLLTQVGDRGIQLSGGQKQRIAIARAFYKKAPILIMDEPTSALDKADAEDVINNVLKYVKNKTTIIITHDPSLLKKIPLVYVVEAGTVRPIEDYGGIDSYYARFPSVL